MIATTDLRLCEFTEHHDEDGFVGAEVTVTHTESTREFTARVVRGDDGPALSRFDDSGETGFVRTAFPALWYCIEEFLTRDIHPDLGALTPPSQTTRQSRAGYETGGLAAEFDRVVEHDRKSGDDSTDDTDTDDTDTDTPADADTEAPQPEPAVSDGGAVPVVQHEPDTLGPVSPETKCDDDVAVGDDLSDLVDEDDEDETHDGDRDEDDSESDADTVEACPNCDDTGSVYSRETKPADERWRCSACDTTFPEPVVRPRKDSAASSDDDDADLPDERPQWLAGSPEEIVSESKTYLPLDAVIEAVVQEDDIPNVARRLGRSTTDVRGTVLQPLGLLESDGGLVDDETLDDRLAVISRWDDGQ